MVVNHELLSGGDDGGVAALGLLANSFFDGAIGSGRYTDGAIGGGGKYLDGAIGGGGRYFDGAIGSGKVSSGDGTGS